MTALKVAVRERARTQQTGASSGSHVRVAGGSRARSAPSSAHRRRACRGPGGSSGLHLLIHPPCNSVNSPGHRQNLFRPEWRTIGIALLGGANVACSRRCPLGQRVRRVIRSGPPVVRGGVPSLGWTSDSPTNPTDRPVEPAWEQESWGRASDSRVRPLRRAGRQSLPHPIEGFN